MLPMKHFDAIEKEAMDMLRNSTDSTVKKVVDIKENAIDKNAKPLADDEYDDEYDYTNDDIDNDGDEIISITPKSVSVSTTTTGESNLHVCYE